MDPGGLIGVCEPREAVIERDRHRFELDRTTVRYRDEEEQAEIVVQPRIACVVEIAEVEEDAVMHAVEDVGGMTSDEAGAVRAQACRDVANP